MLKDSFIILSKILGIKIQIHNIEINKETLALNNKLGQMDLTDICEIFVPKSTEYAFSSSTQNKPNKFNTEIMLSIISDHSGMTRNKFQEENPKVHRHEKVK